MHRREQPGRAPVRDRDPVPADPVEWRPQVHRATRKAPTIADPLVEPLWSGTRVIAHFEADGEGGARRLLVLDSEGDEPADLDDELRDALGKAILCFDAVVDGVLSREATRSGEGASIIHQAKVSRGSIFWSRDVDLEVGAPVGQASDVVAFVAIDLLRIDGTSLLDLPLLERKRLLDSTIAPSDRVRLSPYTRPPIDPWVASWKSAGLRGAMLKAANSRYVPGGYSEEWTPITRLQQRR